MDIEDKVESGVTRAFKTLLGLGSGGAAVATAQLPALNVGTLAAAPMQGEVEEHPVLKLALKDGIDTEAKYAQLQDDAKIGKAALAEKRDYAKKAAAAFFGTGSETAKAALARAERTVDAQTDLETLSAMTETWLDSTPGANHAGARVTRSAKHGTTPADGEADGEGDDEGEGSASEDLSPSAIYAARNKR